MNSRGRVAAGKHKTGGNQGLVWGLLMEALAFWVFRSYIMGIQTD